MDATVEVLRTLSSTMFYNDVLVNLTPVKVQPLVCVRTHNLDIAPG